jgi:RNA polymerase-binding transcription factor DksA
MLDEKFVKKQKKIVESDIARLEKEVAANRKYYNIGSNNEDNTLEFEAFEEKLALTKNDEKELKELKKALARIEEGKYGICQKCGEPIELGRLKAYPAATYCATHAKTK